jgi:5-methylthioadenosine/S-adenosylhomocysteine deaminase
VNVDESDLELIRQSAAGIAHCPKSNAKLGHGRAPFTEFIKHELNVGLGSDSVAGNNTCDILEEARFATLLARLPSARNSFGKEASPAHDCAHAERALFSATLGGARALGLDARIGALAGGMQADLTVVCLSGIQQQPFSDPAVALVFASSGQNVLLTVVAGKEIYRKGLVSAVDEHELSTRLVQVRRQMDSIS